MTTEQQEAAKKSSFVYEWSKSALSMSLDGSMSGIAGYSAKSEPFAQSPAGGYDTEMRHSSSSQRLPDLAGSEAPRGLLQASAEVATGGLLGEPDLAAPPELSDDINFAKRDWNADYQALLETRFDTADMERGRVGKLRSLAEDFARVATAIGTTIISERFMKPEERSVEVIEKLGVAGGEKYVHGPQRIFFKLCVDSHGLYGGDEGAAKAAGNEMRGLIEYSDCRLANLRFPLVVLIDYLGSRIIAEPILPIDRTTLVYGSSDGGRTIRSEDEQVRRLMQKAAKKLNLTTHVVWDQSRSTCHALSSCVDLEVHRSHLDSRLYLIDAARAMPPTPPVAQLKGCNLYRQFRPEFVASHPKPLCPDAFGGWPVENREKLEADVEEAFLALIQNNCPRLVADLEALSLAELSEVSLSVRAHQFGVNMRYLGACFGIAKTPAVRILLISEVVSRTIKQVLRHRMRAIRSDLAETYHTVVIEGLNGFLVGEDENYWGREFKRSLVKRFPGTLSKGDIDDVACDVRLWCSPCLVLRRVCALLSLSLTARAQLRVFRLFFPQLKDLEECEAGLVSPEWVSRAWPQRRSHNDPFGSRLLAEDISAMTPRVKTLHVLPFEEGTALARHAEKDDDFRQAYSCYRDTVSIKPSDLRALHNWGISCTLHAVALLSARAGEDANGSSVPAQGAAGDVEGQATTLFRRAVAKYRTCISINSQDWVALYLWGNTLLSEFGAMLRHKGASSADLLHRARERYESAWVACVGSSPPEAGKELSLHHMASGRVCELLYAWGNSYLLEALHCSPAGKGAEKLLRAAVVKYREAISMSEDSRKNTKGKMFFVYILVSLTFQTQFDHSFPLLFLFLICSQVMLHSIDYRLLYNLSVALARLIGQGGEHFFLQADEALSHLVTLLEGPPPPTLLYHWASLVTKHVRQMWGSLGVGREKRQTLEAHVLQGLLKWAAATDECLSQDDSLLAAALEGWGQLLFVWSEMRFKLYGTHQSAERVQSSITNSPKVGAKKAASKSGILRGSGVVVSGGRPVAQLQQLQLQQQQLAQLAQQRRSQARIARSSSGLVQQLMEWPDLTGSDYSESDESGVSTAKSAQDEEDDDEEEDQPESSDETDDSTGGVGQPVAEDVYIFCVDLFLYTFVSSYKGRQQRPRLDCLVLLGASKEYILSGHTIQTLLSLASENRDSQTREDCERCLQAVQRTGGNHKLKLDADLDMFLPEVVRRGIAEAVQRRAGGVGAGGIHEGPFATGDKEKERRLTTEALTLVEPIEYHDLFHGDTVASLSSCE